jgi:hypothetical protein
MGSVTTGTWRHQQDAAGTGSSKSSIVPSTPGALGRAAAHLSSNVTIAGKHGAADLENTLSMPRTGWTRAWWSVAAVLVVPAVMLAPALSSQGALLSSAIPLGCLAAIVAGALMLRRGDVPLRWLGNAATAGLLGVLTVLAMSTYVRVSGAAAGLLVLAMGSWSPPVLSWWRRRRGRQPHATPSEARARESVTDAEIPPLLVDQPASVAVMPTLQIARAWRRSCWELAQTPSCCMRAEIVRRRQAYLDEMERRDPAGFRGWLDAQPRAADLPLRFFGPPDPPATKAS